MAEAKAGTGAATAAAGTGGAGGMHRYRSHTCGALKAGDIGKVARLSGWVHRVRDHGGVLFIEKSLSSFVAGFKSSVTKRIRDELNETGIWQRNYHDRNIRDDKE